MPRNETLWSQSLTRFRDAVAAPSPTPSCGAAAVVSANLGLALVLMALRTSQAKQPQTARAARKTSAVALDAARCCAQALALASEARPQTADALVSDIEAGALLLHAGLCALLINLDVDLRELVDESERQRLRTARQQVQDEADRHLGQIRAASH